ncbi:hypothetical protein QO002_005670 [Pararhizobium capsulatum DSM 1112]|uniref:Uncharacterized protein n=1 Tax=Pararhizobium capsulatum DSM 1112 TaxID=1121113 RepID=A0ABU0BYY7_9HYPH|nr:hypothetical protein [Pararhizobium capsulatum]MDQ0323464.1 hypothetical protein [Pararhizobium capsulatum DSM 1112]
MGVKENAVMAGCLATIIGIARACTLKTDIPDIFFILVWLPFLGLIGCAAYQMYQFLVTKVRELTEKEKHDA